MKPRVHGSLMISFAVRVGTQVLGDPPAVRILKCPTMFLEY
jgi:hypothetical protein